jgi:hypothetical protein
VEHGGAVLAWCVVVVVVLVVVWRVHDVGGHGWWAGGRGGCFV